MKAMILAAGFGNRLAPYTDHTPKPLFTIGDRPLLDRIIHKLHLAGAAGVIINTHHLHTRIQAFLDRQTYAIPVAARHEKAILGTGGGIRNVADFWENDSLLVINSDIVTDIDLTTVIANHRHNGCPVTMVMHDCPEFNSVWVDTGNKVISLRNPPESEKPCSKLAFTGIHIIERTVLDYLPGHGFATIIDAYQSMLDAGYAINAHVVQKHYWRDIGTPDSYQRAVFDHLAPIAFNKAHGSAPDAGDIERCPLSGDGSDRRWTRLKAGGQSLIMADHGIRPDLSQQEVDAFVAVGNHLKTRGICVPTLYAHDCFAGLVFLEDLGEEHLQQRVVNLKPADRHLFYGQVIDEWIKMAVRGTQGFDPAWTYQSTHYDRDLILDRECRYFTDAFLQGYLNQSVTFDMLQDEFEQLVREIERNAVPGLIHRDFQSRNIMLKGDAIHFIDFQGARFGPIQYDLASLLIDPYAALSQAAQNALLQETASKLERRFGYDAGRFVTGYRFCSISRNLQILGAFAFLSMVKGKKSFETYIPGAVVTLSHNLARLPLRLPGLAATIDAVKGMCKEGERQ